MSHYTVGLMSSEDRARWDAFVQDCPAATFFHRAGWQQVMEEGFGHPTWFLYAAEGDRIAAVLPLAQIKSRLFGNTLCSLPFCVYGGIAAMDAQAAQAVDLAAQQLAARLRVDHLEYRHREPYHADWLHKQLYATFRKPLLADPEQNLLAIPRKQRAMVRKGIQNGLRSEIDRDATRLHRVYGESVRNLGTPVFSKKYFELLLTTFPENSDIITITTSSGQPVASVLNFYFRDEVLPYYGGGTIDARRLAANDFMYWEVMRRACERGYRVFDFGRSKIGTGAYDFKTYWNFEPTPLVYQYRLAAGQKAPDLNPLNPKFALFVRLWQKLPLAVAARLGPSIVRGLG